MAEDFEKDFKEFIKDDFPDLRVFCLNHPIGIQIVNIEYLEQLIKKLKKENDDQN